MTTQDSRFTGSIPDVYERYMVPMIFEDYAVDLADRAAQCDATRVLELAAGTGVVTRRLAERCAQAVEIVATDLNQAMLDRAVAIGTSRAVQWRTADAMRLPFGDGEFDVVVCQFGAMFFPNKAEAFCEARRVLRLGGTLVFNVWERIELNEFPHEVSRALAQLWPGDPPRFMERIPHGYYDPDVIRRDLRSAGFTALPEVETVTKVSIARAPRDAAIGFCQGTPLRAEIEARSGKTLAEATQAAEGGLRSRFGDAQISGKIAAHVVAVQR